ncbi:MAG: hypothetical protein AAB892_01560 [Patescibacteria group bacterium]
MAYGHPGVRNANYLALSIGVVLLIPSLLLVVWLTGIPIPYSDDPYLLSSKVRTGIAIIVGCGTVVGSMFILLGLGRLR